MYDELTEVDIRKMEEELKYRREVVAPPLEEEVRRTREYGDLSENAEYHCAKQERNKNRRRIRYLENMILTAKVIHVEEHEDQITLFDYVTFFNESRQVEKRIQIVTTLRQDALKGFISKESPMGMALLGHKVGDRVLIKVSDTMSYYVTIRKIEKGVDNEDLPISQF